MGPLAKFLLALTNLVRSGAIRKISDAIRFAKQEFGQVTPLLQKQIEKIFESVKKPVVGKPGKKEGTILPFARDTKKTEGIETLDKSNVPQSEAEKDIAEIQQSIDDLDQTEAEADAFSESIGFPQDSQNKKLDELMNFFQKEIDKADVPKLDSKENIMGVIDKLKNPRRPGGPLDPVQGITRTLVRRILDKKGIKIDRREDPIDIFLNKFGIDIGLDVQNLAEEIVEAEQIGRQLKPVDDLLEIEGFFDIEMPKNPNQGIPTDDLIEQLEKDLEQKEQKEMLEGFDIKDRDPNAKGGLTRTSYAMGRGPVLPEDPTKPINPFQPKPTGPVLPDKSIMAMDDTPGFELEDFPKLLDEFELDNGRAPVSIDELKRYFKIKYGSDRLSELETSGRVRAASGGLAEILKV